MTVDLTNLRSMTDGDIAMEKALFQEFFSAFENGISVLQAHRTGDHEIWRRQAHALKAISINLGAGHLGALCRQAQDYYLTTSETKKDLLEKIGIEYAQTKIFLTRQQESASTLNV